jgi:hypothetical protein
MSSSGEQKFEVRDGDEGQPFEQILVQAPRHAAAIFKEVRFTDAYAR